MNTLSAGTARFALLLCSILLSGSAFAQATRTWVSGVGDDANPCSRTAPCKTFAGAISKTAAGGEINVIDPGGFGAVNITKSITIDGNGQLSSILNAGVSGVLVNAGAGDVVILRNLTINGATTGTNGVRLIAGGALHMENITIEGSTTGISLQPSGATEVTITDTTVTQTTTGVLMQPTGAGTLVATLEHVVLDNNGTGLKAHPGSIAAVRASSIGGNTLSGVAVVTQGLAGSAQVTVSDSLLAGNNIAGVATEAALMANGAQATLNMASNLVAQNGVGMVSLNAGVLNSLENNYVDGNAPNGDPTTTEATR